MGILIDSSVLIDWERGQIDVSGGVLEGEEEMFLSVITASELLHGVWRARDRAVRAKRSAFVEGVLAQIPVLPVDVSVARAHAQLWADLHSRGRMIGVHDSWIAATCLSHGFALATGNQREFRRVPGLTVEVWA